MEEKNEEKNEQKKGMLEEGEQFMVNGNVQEFTQGETQGTPSSQNLACEIVQDLLPSYVEKLTSEVTNLAIQRHMKSCNACQAVLTRMQAPEPEMSVELEFAEKKEIDYLKKERKKTWQIMMGCALLVFFLLAGLLASRYLIGKNLNDVMLAYQVQVNGKELQVALQSVDETNGIKGVSARQEGNVVYLTGKRVSTSFLYGNTYNAYFEMQDSIWQVYWNDQLIWENGEQISGFTAELFESKHPYVGDMPANGVTAKALHIANYLGNFTNALQTGEEPYGWTLKMNTIYSAQQLPIKEQLMRDYGMLLLACVDNLGEVHFEYRVDDVIQLLTVTQADASEFAGADIKEIGKSASALERLVQKTSLNALASNTYVPSGSLLWSNLEQGEDRVVIQLSNQTGMRLSSMGISYEIGLEEDPNHKSGSSNMIHADGSLIGLGELDYFTLEPIDVGDYAMDGTTPNQIWVHFEDESGQAYEVPMSFSVELRYGVVTTVDLEGSAADGFSLVVRR